MPESGGTGAARPIELKVDDLSVSFGGTRALGGVNVTVFKGDRLGVIGPNGAGKTTLLNVITGLVRPTTGRVMLRDADITKRSAHRIIRGGIGRSFQLADGFADFTVWDYTHLGLAAGARVSRRVATGACSDALRDVGLLDRRTNRLSELPYGSRKLLDVARAVVMRPSVLLLDEPTSGLSNEERVELVDRLQAVREHTATVIVVDHDVGFITAICDPVLALGYGLPLAFGSAAEVLAHPDVISSYLGYEPKQLK